MQKLDEKYKTLRSHKVCHTYSYVSEKNPSLFLTHKTIYNNIYNNKEKNSYVHVKLDESSYIAAIENNKLRIFLGKIPSGHSGYFKNNFSESDYEESIVEAAKLLNATGMEIYVNTKYMLMNETNNQGIILAKNAIEKAKNVFATMPT